MDCFKVRRCGFFILRRIHARFLTLILISLVVLNLYYMYYGSQLSDATISHYIRRRQTSLASLNRAEFDGEFRAFDPRGGVHAAKDSETKRGRRGFARFYEESKLERNDWGRFVRFDDQQSSLNQGSANILQRKEQIDELQFESKTSKNSSPQSEQSVGCKEFFLTGSSKSHSYGKCEPHKPTEASCMLAQSLYKYDPSLSECKGKVHEICSLTTKQVNKTTVLKARCDSSVCDELLSDRRSSHPVYKVHILDPDDGLQKLLTEFSSARELEAQLPRISEESAKSNLNFVFVSCFDSAKEGESSAMASQLLYIPPRFTVQKISKSRSQNAVNVNIVFLDSVSRAHFYRSLPKTIETFRNWAKNPRTSPARVFDFELFQAVHGHTTHNEHALFTGELLAPFTPDYEMPPVGSDVLFGHFKDAGYETMWQEDLCWTGNWGLIADLAAEDWEDLQAKLRQSFVDSTGITHSSCEVLGSFGLDSPFNGPEGDQICYNGKLQHSYFLQYSLETLTAIGSSHKTRPILSFTALNAGHDDTGRRIQSMDSELARYVTATAHDQNTLTIILADHGNTYTEYTSVILEGRFEIFHPSLFVIVPNRVAKLLGRKAMSALEFNQRRLVTMIDVHHTLIPLVRLSSGPVKPIGLFSPIENARTCDNVELRTPNLCVCEGWDSPTTNDSMKIAIVEFAIGELNNMVHAQYAKNVERSKTFPILGSCERFRPLRFENVRERNSKSDGHLITSLDIHVKAGNVVNKKEDVIHVQVKSKEMPNQDSLEMELIHYDRLTLFGKYKKCADQGVQLKLCICSDTKDHPTDLKNVPWAEYSTFLDTLPLARKIDEEGCLFLVKRNHSEGQSVAFEVANTCALEDFTLKISAAFDNVKLSRKLPLELTVVAGSVMFAFSARKETEYWDSSVDIIVDIINIIPQESKNT